MNKVIRRNVGLHEAQRVGAHVDRVLRPASWTAALLALNGYPNSRPIAGGTDLLLDLARTPGPSVTLVDLSSVDGAYEIVETDNEFLLGAGVTHNQIVGDRQVHKYALPLGLRY